MTDPYDRTPPRRSDYAARRMLGTTVAITVVVVIAVLAWGLIRNEPTPASSATTGWQRIVVVDQATGGVIGFDGNGQVIDRTAGTGPVLDLIAYDGRLALIGENNVVLPGPAPTVIGVPPAGTVRALETLATMHLLVGHETGGNLVIVDLATGAAIDVGASAAPTVPKLFVDEVRANDAGTRFAIADAANFQTIVVGADIDGAAFLADRPIAVGTELIATARTINQEADISLVHLDRRSEALVASETPGGAAMVGDALIMASTSGGLYRIAPGAGEAERIGSVSVPSDDAVTSVTATHRGQRLVVSGSTFVAAIDLDGTTIVSTSVSGPVITPRPRWRCLPIGGADSWQAIVDLETGGRVAELAGDTVTDISADGCTVVVERDGVFEIVGPAGRIRLGQLTAVALAPDATAVVWTTTTGRTELLSVGPDLSLGSPIELPGTPSSSLIAFL